MYDELLPKMTIIYLGCFGLQTVTMDTQAMSNKIAVWNSRNLLKFCFKLQCTMNINTRTSEFSTLVAFVPEKREDQKDKGTREDNSGKRDWNLLSGDDARQFYEETLKIGNKESAKCISPANCRKGPLSEHTCKVEKFDKHSRSRTTKRQRQKHVLEDSSKERRRTDPHDNQVPCSSKQKQESSDSGPSSKLSNHSGHEFLRLAQDGNVDKLKKLLRSNVDTCIDINFCDEFGWNALMCAAHNGHLDVVKVLLQSGIDQKKM